MGCSMSKIRETVEEMFCKKSRRNSTSSDKANLERKLYLARESPEPIFDLSECQLKNVPSGIYSICKVFRKDHLYLNNNRLHSLEDGGQIADLQFVKVLNISCNIFSELNSDIRYLVSLTELYVRDNELRYLPESIYHLQCLKILDVSKNKLKELTPSLGKLKSLKKLNIKENEKLNMLCVELCLASSLTCLEMDGENFIFPPVHVTTSDTAEIMKFLCNEMNVEYVSPESFSEESSPVLSPSSHQNVFNKKPMLTWDEQEAKIIEQENRLHEASKQQREIFLSQILQEQSILDAEIAKVQELKELDKQKLIKDIQRDEKEIEMLVNNFIQSSNLKPEVIQQQVEYEEAELNRLLEITRQNYNNVRKQDILKAMDTLLEENCAFQQTKRNYDIYLDNIKSSMLAQELECMEKVELLLKTKDESRILLSEQLLEDQDIQKALVASLLEKVDSKTWSLNQEISLITSNLARLSVIEQEKQKLNMNYNYNQLLHQRVQLVEVLNDLLEQQNKRRTQLVETLKEMESETNMTTDFWLRNYQKLLDSAPRTLLNAGKTLDPQLANNLLQEGVIHCLPFLVKFLFSENSLLEINEEELKANGVQLSQDRKSILKAIQDYVALKTKLDSLSDTNEVYPTAPSASTVEESNCCGVLNSSDIENGPNESECVICMDANCEVVFVPCGHMCCCLTCSNKEMSCCPMCRTVIEKKIKVMIP